MTTWTLHRDEYLDEQMRSEGRGDNATSCAGTCEGEAPYRCTDCLSGAMWCLNCIKLRHDQTPLHFIEVSIYVYPDDHVLIVFLPQEWNGSFFERRSLQALGLRVQLGHLPHRHCPTSEAGHVNFVVIHTNGIHQVSVDFCRCRGLSHRQQLLRAGWWPATPLEPQTCATLEVLRHFHLLNLQAKVAGYGFMKALELQTDNTGLHPPPVSLILIYYYYDRSDTSIGSAVSFHEDDTRIPPCQDGEAWGSSIRRLGHRWHRTGISCCRLSCMSHPGHQSSTRLGGCSCESEVSLLN